MGIQGSESHVEAKISRFIPFTNEHYEGKGFVRVHPTCADQATRPDVNLKIEGVVWKKDCTVCGASGMVRIEGRNEHGMVMYSEYHTCMVCNGEKMTTCESVPFVEVT
jgi:hypothetical protein